MEVFLLAGLGVGLFIISIFLYTKNKNLNEEAGSLGEMLRKEISDNERNIEDHRATERELSIIKAKLETLEQSSLTPDNSIPKEIHVEKVLDLSNRLGATEMMLKEVTEKFEESRGKQISERVRLGQTAENFAAFFSEFPYNRKNVKALFQPVDLICFEEDEVIFIDVKTGGAQLSRKQRKIRDNIKAGKVRFEVHRLDENGYTIKRED